MDSVKSVVKFWVVNTMPFFSSLGAVFIRAVLVVSAILVTITNIAGTGVSGYNESPLFNLLTKLTFDSVGNMYVVDTGNYRIRKITPQGVCTTLAGSGSNASVDGTGTNASFNNSLGIEVDSLGNVYVVDTGNNRIRKITPTGTVSTFAGNASGSANGVGTNATFSSPRMISKDSLENLYITEFQFNRIRKITPAGVVSTLITITSPWDITFDLSNNMYVTQNSGGIIYKVTPSNVVTTLVATGTIPSPSLITFSSTENILYVATSRNIYKVTLTGTVTLITSGNTTTEPFSDGSITSAGFPNINDIAIDLTGNIYVVDTNNHSIRKITLSGYVTTPFGNQYIGSANGPAQFNQPNGIFVDLWENVYVADTGNHRICKINKLGIVSTLAGNGTASVGNGTGTNATFNSPRTLILYKGILLTGEIGISIRQISPTTRTVSNMLITGLNANYTSIRGMAVHFTGNVYLIDSLLIIKFNSVTTARTTFAGSTQGFANGTGTNATFNNPSGIAVDSLENVYVADTGNHCIRKITPSGIVSTLAGGTQGFDDGGGTNARFNAPEGVAVDLLGNVYVSDTGNNRIRKITKFGYVTTVIGLSENLSNPSGIAIDFRGNLYFSDRGNNRIRKINNVYTIPENNSSVSVFAGSGVRGNTNGTKTSASFDSPYGLAFDSTGNVYVADSSNHRIRKITPQGVVTYFAGTGVNTPFANSPATFNYPYGIAVDSTGNIYVADRGNHRIRKITPTGTVSTLAGNGTTTFANGTGTNATFSFPNTVAVDSQDNIYVLDSNYRIRKITPTDVVTTFAGSGAYGSTDGTIYNSTFGGLIGMCIDSNNIVYVFDTTKIRKITPAGVVTTLAGSSTQGSVDGVGTNAQFNSNYPLCGMTLDVLGNIYIADRGNHCIRKITPAGVVTTLAGSTAGSANGTGTNATFNGPLGVAVDSAGTVYVTDSSNHLIRKIGYSSVTIDSITQVIVNTLAGSTYGYADGTGTNAGFFKPAGVCVDSTGNIFVADKGGHRIRKITPAGQVTTLAGSGNPSFVNGSGVSAQFNFPHGIAINSIDVIYVADTINNRIRMITQAGVVTTFAGSGAIGSSPGTGTQALFNNPQGIVIDILNNLYVVDTGNHCIRKITPAGVVSTLAGSTQGYADGSGINVKFNNPWGIANDFLDNIYVADTGNHVIRKITTTGVVTTYAGSTPGFLNGITTSARFSIPIGMVIDQNRNIYVLDSGNNLIRKITSEGLVTTFSGSGIQGFADGVGTSASFSYPQGIAVDSLGNLYVGDTENSKIRKII